jgi:hypothetical protein
VRQQAFWDGRFNVRATGGGIYLRRDWRGQSRSHGHARHVDDRGRNGCRIANFSSASNRLDNGSWHTDSVSGGVEWRHATCTGGDQDR